MCACWRCARRSMALWSDRVDLAVDVPRHAASILWFDLAFMTKGSGCARGKDLFVTIRGSVLRATHANFASSSPSTAGVSDLRWSEQGLAQASGAIRCLLALLILGIPMGGVGLGAGAPFNSRRIQRGSAWSFPSGCALIGRCLFTHWAGVDGVGDGLVWRPTVLCKATVLCRCHWRDVLRASRRRGTAGGARRGRVDFFFATAIIMATMTLACSYDTFFEAGDSPSEVGSLGVMGETWLASAGDRKAGTACLSPRWAFVLFLDLRVRHRGPCIFHHIVCISGTCHDAIIIGHRRSAVRSLRPGHRAGFGAPPSSCVWPGLCRARVRGRATRGVWHSRSPPAPPFVDRGLREFAR